MRFTRPLSLLSLCAALGAAACEQSTSGPEEPPPTPASTVVSLNWEGPMPAAQLIGGLSIPVHFRARDASGNPVAGVEISFSSGPEHGSFGTNAQVATDAEGIARTSWTLGSKAGEQKATAAVVGGTATQTLTFQVAEGEPNPPRFLQRSIHLPGPICAAEGQTGSKAAFSLLPGDGPAAIRLATIHPRTGTFSGLFVGFLGVEPGTTRILATDIAGRSDTLTVTVGNSLPVVSLPDTLRLAVGDSAVVPIAVSGPCASWRDNSFVSVHLNADTMRYNSESLAPEIFAVRDRLPFPGRKLVGLKPGTGRVVTRFWGGVDTATVVVR